MREDYREAIEKMFPNGFLLIYPINDQKSVRMAYKLPDEQTLAGLEIWHIVNAIEEAAEKKKEEDKNDKG